jgi:hypothetical protein
MEARSWWRRALVAAAAALSVVQGCRQITGLDGVHYRDDFCKAATDCDDHNACTEESCSSDNHCVHTPVPDGNYPDGITGNCLLIACKAGAESPLPFLEDVDDGNDCTTDVCTKDGATHTLEQGATCHFASGFGTCDVTGKCVAECGATGTPGCPASADPCTKSYCDQAQGKCVLEPLDGVAVPDKAPGQCGGSYCVAGKSTDQFAAAGTPCSGTTPNGNPATLCDGAGQCVACNTAADCNPDGLPMSFCFTASCVNHECVVDKKPDGTQLPQNQQVPKDCQTKVCSASLVVDQPDDADLPDDGNACTGDSCSFGQEVFTPKPLNSACGANGDLFCDGKGSCVSCLKDSQCGVPTDCHQYKCDQGTCADVFTLANIPVSPAGQTPGDCLVQVCDGAGGVKPNPDDNDLPNDGNDCTIDGCAAGTKVFSPVNAGSVCLNNRVCDGSGNCLGGACQGAADCPAGAYCVDGVCCNSMCDTTCAACSLALKGTGLSGDCGVSAPGTDGGDMDCPGPKVCNGTLGASACKLLISEFCLTGTDCLSGNCVDGVCCNSACGGVCKACNLPGNPGICSNIPNGQDPANECAGSVSCNGTGACGNLLGLGQACSLNGECQSGNCVDGVCCNSACSGTCQACNNPGNLGGCSNIPLGQDPANECAGSLVCNGNGGCASPNGTTCAQPSDCLSGNCVDGVCCNSSCSGVCKACNLAGSVGTCSNLPNGQDPANECSGARVCNGSGSCTGGPLGAACGSGMECGSGNCVDGVCCNNTCSGTCYACNLAGSLGTCSLIPQGQPDNSPVCSGANACDGSGFCKKNDGQSCAFSFECVHSHCVDGFCCNTACNGLCQACNVTGLAGTCSSVPNGQDPSNECVGTTTCDGAGACTAFPNGTTCSQNAECQSGSCIDGVCCGSATCPGPCMSCNQSVTVSGAAGTCDFVKPGLDPRGDCTAPATCNGMGVCQ